MPTPTEDALQKSFQQIERAKQEWESTVDSLSQVICLINRQGAILRANRAIEAWQLGRVMDVKGRALHALLHPACRNAGCELHALFQQALSQIAEGQHVGHELDDPLLQRALSIRLHPIAFTAGRTSPTADSFAIVIVEDISERRAAQERLCQQNQLLLGVAGAMNHLLVTPDFTTGITHALRTFGLSANVDRVYIFETHRHPKTREPLLSQRFEWDRFSEEIHISAPDLQSFRYRNGLQRWYDLLSTNTSVSGLLKELPPEEQEFLAPQNIMSILLVPIMIQERFWGFIGFDDCHSPRRWREEEEAVLFALAGSIGGAIAREHMEAQLRQTSSELRAVFQSLPDDYFRIGADGSLLDYTVSQGGDLHLSPDTFMGKWASGLLDDRLEQQFGAALHTTRETKTPVTMECLVSGSDPHPRYEEIRCSSFMNDQLIVVARDITSRKLVESQLRRRCEQLERRVKN